MICQKILGQKWHKFWRNFFSKPYLQFFDDKGKQAEDGCWVVRYQVRQKEKIYWYYKLQADRPIFEQKNGESLSK